MNAKEEELGHLKFGMAGFFYNLVLLVNQRVVFTKKKTLLGWKDDMVVGPPWLVAHKWYTSKKIEGWTMEEQQKSQWIIWSKKFNS